MSTVCAREAKNLSRKTSNGRMSSDRPRDVDGSSAFLSSCPLSNEELDSLRDVRSAEGTLSQLRRALHAQLKMFAGHQHAHARAVTAYDTSRFSGQARGLSSSGR